MKRAESLTLRACAGSQARSIAVPLGRTCHLPSGYGRSPRVDRSTRYLFVMRPANKPPLLFLFLGILFPTPGIGQP
jgi:hypothetical protein